MKHDVNGSEPAETEFPIDDETFRAVADYTAAWENWFSPKGRLLWVNRAVEQHTGYSPTECLAMSDFPICLVHEADRDFARSHFAGALRGTRGESVLFRVVQKDGSLKWCEAFWQPIFDSVGKNLGHRSSIRDVTKRNRAEEELRRAREEWERTFDAVPDLIAIIDQQKRVVRVNRAMASRLGVSRQECIGRFCYELVHGADSPPRACPHQLFVLDGREHTAEVHDEKLDSEFLVTIAPLPDSSGLAKGCVHVARDITEAKRLETSLRLSEETLRALLNASPDSAFLIDCRGTFLALNEETASKLGKTVDELLGHNAFEHLPDDIAQSRWRHVQEVVRSGESIRFQDQRQGRWIDTIVCPIKDAEGNVSRLAVYGRDVTEERRSHDERETTLVLLRLLNDQNHTDELLRNLTGFLQEWSGCQAVGIRLREGEDFPYCETRGRPPTFAQEEDHLRLRDLDGQIVRDGSGNPVLECMCGDILRGRFDPSLPFFTPHGSFWTNSASDLLASAAKADCQTRICNRCNGKGYESVALIPLRHAKRTLGLLQLNDRVRGRFTPELISFLENAADQIAIALAQRQAQAALQESERRLKEAQHMMHVGSFHVDLVAGRALWSDETYRLFGVDPAAGPLTAAGMRSLVHPDDRDHWDSATQRAIDTGQSVTTEYRVVRADGPVRQHHILFTVKVGPDGQPLEISGTLQDITDRKLAEQAIWNREAALVEAQRIARIGNWEYDVATEKVAWSMEMFRIFGRDHSLGEPSSWSDVRAAIHPGDWERLEKAVQQILADGTLSSVEFRIVNPSWGIKWGHAIARAARDADGRIVKLLGTVQDITDRKEAEVLRWESEAKYCTLFQNMTQGAFRQRADGVLTDVNPAALRMFGLSKSDFLDTTPLTPAWDVIREDGSPCPPNDHPSMRALKRGTPVSGTVLGVFNPQTQSRVWVEVNATPEFHPGEPMPYQVLVTLHDVTERKRSEALIQESEERFRRTFDQAPIGAAIVSLDYRFLRVNPAMCRITGYTEEQLLARRFSDIAPRDGLADDIAQAQRLLTGEIEQYSREKRNIRPNKDTVWVNVSVRLLRDVHGQPLHYLAMIEDITSRKLAEEQQQRLQQQLAHVSRLSTLGEMAAGIAHDVNQPLYSILNYAKACSNLLKQINPQNDKLLEWNAQIAAEATRAGEIIKRMRGFARKEAVRRLPTRVQEVIEESLSLIACETRRLRVKVRKDFAESVLLASCDRIQIQQVVINLLRNACEALEQRTEDERRVMIRTAMAQEFIEVVIADNGPGLQGVEAATIFDAFVTSKPAGLGMGLAISKSIVEAHGGRIWVTTTSEGGASLHFTLPSTLGERGNV